jgi:hypothetical protein
MSIPVEIGDLGKALADFGPGYLLTTSGDGKVKVVTVEPVLTDGELVVVAPGRGSRSNIEANPAVTLLFAPLAPRGYTLLIDGTAQIEGDDARISPATAVLHRPASHADGPPAPDGCGHDCKPVP